MTFTQRLISSGIIFQLGQAMLLVSEHSFFFLPLILALLLHIDETFA